MLLLGLLRPWLARRDALLWITLLAALLALPSLFVGFATDDHFFRMVHQGSPGLPEVNASPLNTFRFFDNDPAARAARLDRGLLPWWSYEEGRLAFMRPLTSLSYWIDYQLFRDTAWPMHAHSILLFALLVISVGALYRRLETVPWAAALAALLYALDDARSLPVGWLSNRNALLAALLGVLVLIAHDRWRRDGWRPGPWLAAPCFALALLAGEAGLAVCGYLAAHALLLDQAPRRQRIAALMPYAAVVVLWRLAYTLYGFGAYGSAGYVDPLAEPGRFAGNLLQHMPLLLSGQFGMPDSSIWIFLTPPYGALYLAAAVLFVGGAAWLLWPFIRNDRTAQFWALGMLLALAPSCATIPQDRLLVFGGIGAMALLARFMSQVFATPPEQLPGSRAWRRAARAAVPVWVLIHLVAAPLLLVNGVYVIAHIERLNRIAANSAPMDPGIADDTLVIVNAPSDLMAVSLPIVRSSMGQPVPRNTWLLSAGTGAVQCHRPDPYTLIVRPEAGFLDRPWAELFRNASRHPMVEGQVIELTGLRITLSAVGADGRPEVVAYRFDKPLEHPSLRWVAWHEGRYVPYAPPAIGASNAIPGMPLARLLRLAAGIDSVAADAPAPEFRSLRAKEE